MRQVDFPNGENLRVKRFGFYYHNSQGDGTPLAISANCILALLVVRSMPFLSLPTLPTLLQVSLSLSDSILTRSTFSRSKLSPIQLNISSRLRVTLQESVVLKQALLKRSQTHLFEFATNGEVQRNPLSALRSDWLQVERRCEPLRARESLSVILRNLGFAHHHANSMRTQFLRFPLFCT